MEDQNETYCCLFEPWYWDYKIRLDSEKTEPTRWMQISGNIFLEFLVYKNNIVTEDLIRYCDLYIYDFTNFEKNKNAIYYGFELEKVNTVSICMYFDNKKFNAIYELYRAKENLEFDIDILFSSLGSSKGSAFYKTKGIWHLDKDTELENVEGIIFKESLKANTGDYPDNFDINHGNWIQTFK